MPKLLSIITATRHKEMLTQLFDNLEYTASNMDSFEVLIKLDDDDSETIAYTETEKRQRPFLIRYIATPRLNGYWSLYLIHNEVLKISSPESYFVLDINDETRFKTHHWDDILRKYIGYFPDDVFRLRISKRKHLEFKSLAECLPYGESYEFFTKKWLSLTEGISVSEAQVDTGQECVNYFLRTQCGYFRDVAVDTIRIANEEAAVSASYGLSGEKWHKKEWGIYSSFAKFLAKDEVENYYRLARKLGAYIWATENNIAHFKIEDDKDTKKILIKTSSQATHIKSFPYKIDFLTWVSILFDIKPIYSKLIDWNKWPPILANQIVARRQLAQLWLSMPLEQVENEYLGDLGKAHKKLLNIYIRNKPLTIVGEYYINNIVKRIDNKYNELEETAFKNDLVNRVLNRQDDKTFVQDLLAALLYCRDDELLHQGFNLSLIPKWLLDDLSPSVFRKAGIEKRKQASVRFIPHPVLAVVRLILIKIKSLIEEILS